MIAQRARLSSGGLRIKRAVVRRLRQRVDLLHHQGRRSHTRILFDDDRLRVAPAVHVELDGELPGIHPRRRRRRHRVVADGGDGKRRTADSTATVQGLVMHVPGEPMHAGGGRQRPQRTEPVQRQVDRRRIRFEHFVRAGVTPHEPAIAAQDLERDWCRGGGLQVVVDDRAFRRIRRRRLVGRQRRVGVHVPAHAVRGLRREEDRLTLG